MAFGLTSTGANNSLSFNTSWPSLQYYGKAYRVTGTGLTYFPIDSPNKQKASNIQLGTYNVESNYAGTGFKRVTVTGWCGGTTLTLTIPNTSGVFTYAIATPDYPQIFINSTNESVTGVVISINNSGTISDGMPVWYVKMLVGYPDGWRESALPYLTLYCFAKVRNQSQPGQGLNVFLSDGSLSYTSNTKTMKVKDIITISSTTLPVPTDLGSLLINDTTSPTPVVAWNMMAKPSFLNVDWGHYLWRQSFNTGNIAYGWDETYGECESYGPVYSNFEQGYIIGGVRLNTSKTARIYGLQGLDAVSYGSTFTSNPGNLITKKENPFPIYIPIIDGADYD